MWQGRLATIASTGALLVIGIGGTIAMYQVFPDREERELDAVRHIRDTLRDRQIAPVAGLLFRSVRNRRAWRRNG